MKSNLATFLFSAPALAVLALGLAACGSPTSEPGADYGSHRAAIKASDDATGKRGGDSAAAATKDEDDKDADDTSDDGVAKKKKKQKSEEQDHAVDPVPAGQDTAEQPAGEQPTEEQPTEEQPTAPEPEKLGLGLRNYDQINQTMSAITGIPSSNATVAAAFAGSATQPALSSSLPTDADARGFLGSQQVAIFKLAVEYCDALSKDVTARAAFYGAFDFAGTPAVVLADAGRAALADTLITKVWGKGLATLPPHEQSVAQLAALINELLVGKDVNSATLTPIVVTSACAATLSSEPVTFY